LIECQALIKKTKNVSPSYVGPVKLLLRLPDMLNCDEDLTNETSLAEFAEARLALVALEYSFFRAAPQISLEILMIALKGGGRCELSTIYKDVRATHPAIRHHLNSLQRQGLFTVCVSTLDRRARVLHLTPKARSVIADYLQTIKKIHIMSGLGMTTFCESMNDARGESHPKQAFANDY
jgi:DNA-binding MarR family transcriptional regulator